MAILETKNKVDMESLNALFEYATEGIIVSDKTGAIIKANPSAERLFGYSGQEFLDKKILQKHFLIIFHNVLLSY
jgi:PAS domain S-box-containing protein